MFRATRDGRVAFELGICLTSADKHGRAVIDLLRMVFFLTPTKGKLPILRKRNFRIGTRIKKALIFLLLLFCVGCFFNNEKTQYIVIQDGKKLQPYTKVIYRVSAEKQEVAYWIETPGKERSQVYKLKKCMVTDPNNWRGEADYILLWKIKVEMVNGKISPAGEGLVNVGWLKWHLGTDPSPGPFSTILWYGFLLFMIFVIIAVALTILWTIKKRGRAAVKSLRNG